MSCVKKCRLKVKDISDKIYECPFPGFGVILQVWTDNEEYKDVPGQWYDFDTLARFSRYNDAVLWANSVIMELIEEKYSTYDVVNDPQRNLEWVGKHATLTFKEKV